MTPRSSTWWRSSARMMSSASMVRKEPAMEPCWAAVGSLVRALARPVTVAIIMPPIESAAISRRATEPRKKPMKASPKISRKSATALSGSGGSTGGRTGSTTPVTVSASSRRMRGEMSPSPKPGSSMSALPSRTKTSSRENACWGSSSASIARPALTEGNHAVEEALGEGRQAAQHEGQHQHDADEDDDDLRHEGERHLLNRGERLEQRDGEADDQRQQHDRRADLQHDDDRLAADLDGFGAVHGRAVRSACAGFPGRPGPPCRAG